MSTSSKISVKFVDDFYNRWVKACLVIEGCEYRDEVIKNYDSKGDLKSLADRISGKHGVVVECEHSKESACYFEELDNNFVIFPELFQILDNDSALLTNKVNE